MEKLKTMIPENLKSMVAESGTQHLPTTTSSLLAFLQSLPLFHQMVRELGGGGDNAKESGLCGKNKEEALQLKHLANQSYLSGDYPAALPLYSQALRVAPMDAVDMGKDLVASLFLNRASLFQRIGLLMECVRDCGRALQISPSYAKAWYRRGKANAALGNYKDAIRDLTVAKTMELSADGRRQIESELKMMVDQHEGTGSKIIQRDESNVGNTGQPHHIALVSVATTDKGRGMVAPCDIPQGSLVHEEEPYAAIILKSCRESHCHHCFNELPADIVPCGSCSVALYCSQKCRLQAGGEAFKSYSKKAGISGNSSNNLEEYIAEVASCSDTDPVAEHYHEHRHECLGVPWPAVLPSDIVLAGRILARSTLQRGGSVESNFLETQGLSHSYSQMTPESKLELHVYAIVLLSCLQYTGGFDLPLNGISLSQMVVLISQIRVNCMAIVQMKSVDFLGPPDQIGKFLSASDALMSSVEQVSVGQAIYTAGSLFNHSCKPNIHAYFLSRTLFVRTTEFVAAGNHLELSYGPQLGQWDCEDRLKILADKYLFQCQCSGCSEVNLSDLVLNAFRCVNPDCDGVVLDSGKFACEINKLKNFLGTSKAQSLGPLLKVVKVDNLPTSSLAHLRPGYCLNCGCHRDLKASHEAVRKAKNHIKNLQNAIASKQISPSTLSDASRALGIQRSIMHEYNKSISQSLDSLAQACCLVGDLKSARDLSKASIKILEMLYDPDHIVIGYELVKLLTIQLSLGEHPLANSINRIDSIFLRYYGPHMCIIFPYLQAVRREA